MKKTKELKDARILKKAKRNSKKRYATTKSFNDRGNDFIPEVKQTRNPDVVLYGRLKSAGKLPNRKGVIGKQRVVTFKEWLDGQWDEIRKRI